VSNHPGFERDEVGEYRPIRFDATYFERWAHLGDCAQEDPPESPGWLKKKLARSQRIADHFRRNWKRKNGSRITNTTNSGRDAA
jgi:NADH:ubiquinone oxidoreductase subunit